MFGERLRFLREERELTQQQVAEAIDSSQQKISNYENETVEPDCDTLMKLADFFETTVDYILGRSNQRRPEGMYAALSELPVEAAKEMETFMEFIRYKYKK
jgi:transcriptional regulator with XRE-family HTH domain